MPCAPFPDQGGAAAPYVRRSGTVLPGGELVFGGTEALTVVLPQEDAEDGPRPLPALVITDIAASEDEPTPLFDAATPTTRARLRVPSGVSRIALEFAAPAYVGANGLRYRYRLQGWDERWSEVDAGHRVAAFTRIAPGQYRFDVEVAEPAGPWQDRGLSIDVDVIPAWHQHRGFHAALVLALLTITAGGVHWRARLLRERARELERMVEARTAALAAANVELEQAHRAVEEASLTDPLTGLHNRRFLWRHIDADVALALRSRYGRDDAAREPSDLLFFLVDIDHFKRINDQHGHAVGDLVLVEMGRRLRAVFRESDHVVRWGGEEFLGVARGAQREDGPRVAERIRRAVAESPSPCRAAASWRCAARWASRPCRWWPPIATPSVGRTRWPLPTRRFTKPRPPAATAGPDSRSPACPSTRGSRRPAPAQPPCRQRAWPGAAALDALRPAAAKKNGPARAGPFESAGTRWAGGKGCRAYQMAMRCGSGRTIGSPSLQPNAAAKAGMLLGAPLARKRAGACGSVTRRTFNSLSV